MHDINMLLVYNNFRFNFLSVEMIIKNVPKYCHKKIIRENRWKIIVWKDNIHSHFSTQSIHQPRGRDQSQISAPVPHSKAGPSQVHHNKPEYICPQMLSSFRSPQISKPNRPIKPKGKKLFQEKNRKDFFLSRQKQQSRSHQICFFVFILVGISWWIPNKSQCQ